LTGQARRKKSRYCLEVRGLRRFILAASSAVRPPIVAPPLGGLRFAFPGSYPFPQHLTLLRRSLSGALLSGQGAAFSVGGQQYAVTFDHQSARANPAVAGGQVPSAAHAFATLGSGSRTALEAAEAWATAVEGLGLAPTVDGASVLVPGASAYVSLGADTAVGPRGWWGMHRDMDDPSTGNGPVNGTAFFHLEMPAAAGRVRGVYVAGNNDFVPRLGVGRGGPWSLTPGPFTDVQDAGQASPINNNVPVALPLQDPLYYEGGEDLWVLLRCGNGAMGGWRWRLADQGDLGNFAAGEPFLSQSLHADPTVPFGSTYDPVAAGALSSFGIHGILGLLIEEPPYRGNCSLYLTLGAQVPAMHDAVGAPRQAAVLLNESVLYGLDLPAIPDVDLQALQFAVGNLGEGEDFYLGLYNRSDVDVPPAAPIELLLDLGLAGLSTANAYNRFVLPTPFAVGSNSAWGGGVLGVTVRSGLIAGGAPSVTQILFDNNVLIEGLGDYHSGQLTGDQPFSDWIDSQRWGALVGPGIDVEIRMQALAGSNHPENDVTSTEPATINLLGQDTPNNLGRVRAEISSAGVQVTVE
jgi:hypothetical protein